MVAAAATSSAPARLLASVESALDAGQLSGVGMDVYNHEAELAVAQRTKHPSGDAEVQATLELARRDIIWRLAKAGEFGVEIDRFDAAFFGGAPRSNGDVMRGNERGETHEGVVT